MVKDKVSCSYQSLCASGRHHVIHRWSVWTSWLDDNIDRSLFLLHGAILDISEALETEVGYRTKQMSWVALDMVCQLVIDVAHYHLPDGIQTMPICCYYNLRAAIDYLQERNKSASSREISRNIEFLLHSEKIYIRKWLF
jgi:hypothetical protein